MNAILIAGAALVGLPILLHLIMKQEPKRLSFPAYRFLKQKLKTNQRKLRLRHFILLALRMLIIALFCLTLYQPAIKSDDLNIRGEQPIATVVVIDSSPSMGYIANGKTRLDEAVQRARELLAELPDKSPVVILDTSDLTGQWLLDAAAARRRLDDIKEPRGGNQTISNAIEVAYQRLANAEKDTESPEQLQKLVAVFTDRTVASWDAGRTEDLKKLRDTIDPKPVHVVFDFGADQPTNVSILAVEMRPQIVAANLKAVARVTVSATGPASETLDATVIVRPAGALKTERTMSKPVAVRNGSTQDVTFEFSNLKPGLNQWEFALGAADNLPFDDTRFLTFKVGASRRILTITDDPKGALYWRAAHVWKDDFDCLLATPDQIKADDRGAWLETRDPKKPNDPPARDDLRDFEVVCLVAVNNPAQGPAGERSLWDKLRPFAQGGGKLIVVPGRDGWTDPAAYGDGAADLLPGKLVKVIDTKRLDPPPPPQTASSWEQPRDGKAGVTWVFDDKALKHPLLKPIEEWRQQKSERLSVLSNPRRTWKFWEVAPNPGSTVVAYYRDADAPEARHPAVLERAVLDPKDNNKPKGKVVLLTTRMDLTTDQADRDDWHDYWERLESVWFVAFPNLLVKYLAGDAADANFNFPTGVTATVPLPRSKLERDSVVAFQGPGLSPDDAIIRPGEKQTELRIGPPRTNNGGNFKLSVTQKEAEIWRDGYSLNVPPEESNLQKVPAEEVEDVVGAGRVVPVAKNVPLRDLLTVTVGGQVDLFPWLLIAVLLALVLEGFLANRFYRKVR
ncbi:MAG: BatA domain-containing protein [Gemmataceae bacterium]|nr:BatA domain-containing protein [Gemmataceae bacterium]